MTPAEVLPVSFAQQRMWFMGQLSPGNPFYNVPAAYRILGPIDVPALKRVVTEIVSRHETLRTRFVLEDGTVCQVIDAAQPIELTYEDLSDAADPVAQAHRVSAAEAAQPFDLSRGPVLRTRLLRLQEDDHVLLINMHHIVVDAWSVRVLNGEISALYEAFAAGRPSPLPPLPIQYADFAVWQRSWLSGEVLDEQLAYWREQLRAMPHTLELPTDRAIPPTPSYMAEEVIFRLDARLVRGLRQMSSGYGTTLFMALLAGFYALLARITAAADLAVGVPVAGRNRSELEGLIGCFVNTLVLRVDCGGDPPFSELLHRVSGVTLDALDHQDLPFERLVEDLHPVRDPSRAALVNVGFQLLQALHTGLDPTNRTLWSLDLAGLQVSSFQTGEATTRLDLELHCFESGDAVSCRLIYAVDLFDGARMRRFASQYTRLLEQVCQAPQRRLSELSLLTEEQLSEQLVDWNDTDVDVPADLTVVTLFEQRAHENPDAVAVSFAGEHLTYGGLNERANRLAHHLSALGVGPESFVGLCVRSGLDQMVGMLGILKAGGAYLPMDPDYPADRLTFMIEDARCAILVTKAGLGLRTGAQRVVELDADRAAIEACPAHSPTPKLSADNVAYAIYTSGSAGLPKGVEVTHRGLTNVILFQSKEFGTGPASKVLQYSSLSFDASVSEIWLAWINGGELVLGSSYLVADELARHVTDRGVTHLALVPSVLATLPETQLPLLKTVLVGGEPAPPGVVNRWSPGRDLFNVYGPTETSVDATIYRCAGPITKPLPIGRPIANTRIYLLDARLRMVPVGVPGEVYIAGTGVSRGYRRRPGLTATRFVPDPFGPRGSRMYRSGDLGRYLPDGNIEFLNRVDDQVKIRGYRVELGEVESTLARFAGVRQVIAGITETPGSGPQLRVYVVPDESAAIVSQERLAEEHALTWRQAFDSIPRGFGEPEAEDGPQEGLETVAAWLTGLSPVRVLEIGVGSAALLRRIAPDCRQYAVAGFSTAAIDHLRFQPEVAVLDQVSFSVRDPWDLNGFEPRSLSAVVVAVSRYLPGVATLDRLVEAAIELVADGGLVVLSDVLDFPAPPAGHELAVTQGHFKRLADTLARAGRLEIVARTGVPPSFDVAIHVGSEPGPHFDAINEADMASDPLADRRREAVAAELVPGLRRYARQWLPLHMVPADVVVVGEIPLTPNGKVDHRALSAIDAWAPPPGREPATSQEKDLCRVFAEILRRDRVGVDDSFFELGGHSLLAIRLLNRILETTGVDVSLGQLFRQPTPAGLAVVVEGAGDSKHDSSEVNNDQSLR